MDIALLRILLVEDSANQAEQLLNQLRSEGLPVTGLRLTELDKLQQQLSDSWDLLIYHHCDSLTLATVLSAIQHKAHDLPVLVLSDDANHPAWQAAGVNDVIPAEHTARLAHSVYQTYQHLALRREHQQLQRRLYQTEKRNQLLLDGAQEAIAYLHDGMHIYSNHAYQALFGYQDADELAGLPFIDLIAPQDHPRIKAYLKQPDTEHSSHYQGINSHGEPFDLQLSSSNAHYDDEPCLQVVLSSSANAEPQHSNDDLELRDLPTGLYTSEHLITQLDAFLNQTFNQRPASSLLQLRLNHYDHLKQQQGPNDAEQYVTQVCEALAPHITEPNLLVKHSANSLLLWLPDTALDTSQPLQDTLQAALSQLTPANTAHLTFGCCPLGEQVQHAQHAISQAEAYQPPAPKTPSAKPASHKPGNSKQRQALKQALSQRQIVVQYQPVISLQGPSRHYYACQRHWPQASKPLNHQRLQQLAAQTQLSKALDQYSLSYSLNLLNQSTDNNQLLLPISHSIWSDNTLLDWLQQRQQGGKLNPNQLLLELDVQEILQHPTEAQHFVQHWHALGGQCGVYNIEHEEHLKSLFTQKLNLVLYRLAPHLSEQLDSPIYQTTLKHCLDLIHSQRAASLVSQIHSASQLAFLWNYQASYIQGDYLHPAQDNLDFNFNQASITG